MPPPLFHFSFFLSIRPPHPLTPSHGGELKDNKASFAPPPDPLPRRGIKG
ncbi:MAG: hypothetical protein LBP62_01000 [Clostridiales bacterium]|nr:hypothetical protein [Clostridiales bacterium]